MAFIWEELHCLSLYNVILHISSNSFFLYHVHTLLVMCIILYVPPPTKSPSHSHIFLFCGCSCFVIQCWHSPTRKKFLVQSQHYFLVFCNHSVWCLQQLILTPHSFWGQPRPKRNGNRLYWLGGLLGSIQQLAQDFCLITHGFWNQHCQLI